MKTCLQKTNQFSALHHASSSPTKHKQNEARPLALSPPHLNTQPNTDQRSKIINNQDSFHHHHQQTQAKQTQAISLLSSPHHNTKDNRPSLLLPYRQNIQDCQQPIFLPPPTTTTNTDKQNKPRLSATSPAPITISKIIDQLLSQYRQKIQGHLPTPF